MKKQLLLLTLGFWLALGSGAQAAMRVDIYGPGKNIVNLALGAPLLKRTAWAPTCKKSCRKT